MVCTGESLLGSLLRHKVERTRSLSKRCSISLQEEDCVMCTESRKAKLNDSTITSLLGKKSGNCGG